ncbi:MAG: hypothetical protein ABL984_05335 [Pyrinomonadaceae bacterium]
MGNQSFETEDNAIIQTIQDAVRTDVIKVAPDEYLTRNVYLPPPKPHADEFKCSSLTGLVDYLNASVDENILPRVVVHVISPTKVEVLTAVEDVEQRRFTALVAKADVPTIGLIGSFVAHEEAMIQLQALFVNEGQVVNVLKNLGSVVADEELTQGDDGVTQEIVVKSMIERGVQKMDNPVALKPFRTFTEINQPESPFILRLKKGNGLYVALFEADGGKWRNKARTDIKDFLTEKIENKKIPILA